MFGLLLAIYVLVCFALTTVILLQSSKGGGLAGVFGGSNMGTVFGGRGAATFLSKMTTVLATLFLVMSLFLAMIVRGGGGQESLVAKQRKKIAGPAANLPAVPVQQFGAQPGATSDSAK